MTGERRIVELAASLIEKKMEEYRRLIQTNFQRVICNPLQDKVEAINRRFGSAELSHGCTASIDSMSCTIKLPGHRLLSITVFILHESVYRRQTQVMDVFDRKVHNVEVVGRPTLRNQKIMAWGQVMGPDSSGFNLILLEDTADPYGKWMSMRKHLYWLRAYPAQRSRTFCNGDGGTAGRIELIDAMDVYRSVITEFEIRHVTTLIQTAL